MATLDGEAMRSLQAHMEDMRSLTLCKICLRPFFEPFILGCGHSFCYSCLRSWFGNPTERKKNKNCPDCRTDVRAEPAPNYLLREIAHLFTSRAELLPDDESVEEHKKDQNEESELLSKDKKGAGLFQGVFKSRPFPPLIGRPIRDFEDDVDRCPICAWEVVDGTCNRCGLPVGDSTDYSEDDEGLSGLSDMDDESLSESDGDESLAADQHGVLPHPHFYSIDIEDEEEEEDDNGSHVNQYDQEDDFVDNEDEIDMDDIDAAGGYDNYPIDAATPYSDAESDIDDDPIEHRHYRQIHRIHDSDEESDSTDPEPSDDMVRAFSPPVRGRRPIVVSDDEDEDSEPHQPAEQLRTGSSNNVQPFMMPDLSEVNTDETDSEDDAGTEDSGLSSESDSDSEDSTSTSSSDSSDATIEDSNAAGGGDHAGEESDDTVIPPQPKRIRQNRLQERRDNRGGRSSSENANMASNGRLRITHASGPARNNRRGRLTSVY